MSMRNRILLFVTAAFVLVVALSVGANLMREHADAERLAEVQLSNTEALWNEVLNNTARSVESETLAMLYASPLAQALKAGDVGAIGERARGVRDALAEHWPSLRLALVDRTGKLVFHSDHAMLLSDGMIPLTLLDRVIQDRTPRRGARLGPEGAPLAVAVFPLVVEGQAIGAAIAAVILSAPLESLAGTLEATVFAVDRADRRTFGPDNSLWTAITEQITPGHRQVAEVVDGGHHWTVTSVPITAMGGGQVGSVLVAVDSTAEANREQLLYTAHYVGTALLLLIALVTLHLYLRDAFRPLDDAIGVLDSLSRGETDNFADLRSGTDEIGRITGSIEVFRRNALELELLAGQGERRRRRQARLIRRQMEALAATLDQDARTAVLNDLHQIEEAEANGTLHGRRAGDDLGLIAAAFERMAARITDQQNHLTELIAALRAAIEERAKLASLQQELSIARTMQLSILPREFPDRPEIQIAARMIPAKEVGGDFYDVFQLDERRIGVVVADVSGKGIPAAFFMLIARTLLRAMCLSSQPSPGPALERLNAMLSDENEQMMFVTVFYGELDLTTGEFVYANGGHNPPLLFDGRGRVEPLPTTKGVALGVAPDLPYVESRIRLEPGQCVALFTDGITEAFDPHDDLFGDARLERLLSHGGAAVPPPSADEWIDRIFSAVHDFAADAPQSDDMTCVVLRVPEAGA